MGRVRSLALCAVSLLPVLLLLCLSLAGAALSRSPYEVLGVAATARLKEVKAAYRAQSLRYHPDKNRDEDATERFREVAEAYSVLSDEERRRQYDRSGSTDANAQARNQHQGPRTEMDMEDALRMFDTFMDEFEDILSDDARLNALVEEYFPWKDDSWTTWALKGVAKRAVRTFAPSLVAGIKSGDVSVHVNGAAVSGSGRRRRPSALHGRERARGRGGADL